MSRRPRCCPVNSLRFVRLGASDWKQSSAVRLGVRACAGSAPRAFSGLARGRLGPASCGASSRVIHTRERPSQAPRTRTSPTLRRRQQRWGFSSFSSLPQSRNFLASLRCVQAVTHASSGLGRDVIDAGCIDARRGAGTRSLRPFPSKATRGGRRRGRRRRLQAARSAAN